MGKNIQQMKERLESEKNLLEKEMGLLGRKNPENLNDWEALPPETEDEAEPDKNIAADMVEGFEEAVSIQGELEQRLFQIKEALKRIGSGTYGSCETCGKEIEEERLLANPAASTCIEHKEG